MILHLTPVDQTTARSTPDATLPMKKEILDDLHTIFSKYETALTAKANAKAQVIAAQRSFVHEFYQKRDLVIRPAMEMIGAFIVDRGHSFEITTQDDAYDEARNLAINARIDMLIREHVRQPDENRVISPARFSAVCSKSSSSIQFHEDTLGARRGGQVAITGDCRLSEVTVDEVQRRLVKIVARIF